MEAAITAMFNTDPELLLPADRYLLSDEAKASLRGKSLDTIEGWLDSFNAAVEIAEESRDNGTPRTLFPLNWLTRNPHVQQQD